MQFWYWFNNKCSQYTWPLLVLVKMSHSGCQWVDNNSYESMITLSIPLRFLGCPPRIFDLPTGRQTSQHRLGPGSYIGKAKDVPIRAKTKRNLNIQRGKKAPSFNIEWFNLTSCTKVITIHYQTKYEENQIKFDEKWGYCESSIANLLWNYEYCANTNTHVRIQIYISRAIITDTGFHPKRHDITRIWRSKQKEKADVFRIKRNESKPTTRKGIRRTMFYVMSLPNNYTKSEFNIGSIWTNN